ncbi:MAG: hypothetical protein ACYSU5_18675 [Planctomycetota bacterium]
MAYCCRVDREFDVAERPPACLDTIYKVAIDATASGISGNRL